MRNREKRRECSYSLPLPSLPTPASGVNLNDNAGRSAERDPAASGIPEASSTPDRHATLPASTDADARFSLTDLQLLEHARTERTASMRDVQPACSQWLHLGYAETLRHPFLMDQLLALAAAHKSTTVPSKPTGPPRTFTAPSR
ncbi:hypothetical protein MY11210_004801 [Beauveria gryllotalpidicola]